MSKMVINEIRSKIKNTLYYNDAIEKLFKELSNETMKDPNKEFPNSEKLDIIIENIGLIDANLAIIKAIYDIIQEKLDIIEKAEKKLYKEEGVW